MKHQILGFTGILARTAVAAALLALGGCVSEDLMNDDNIRSTAHSSDSFPLSAARAGQSHCGNWPEDLTESSDNTRYANHGCAVQHNIAMMIADPRTISQPHVTDPPMGAAAAAAVRNVNSSKSSGSSGSGMSLSISGP